MWKFWNRGSTEPDARPLTMEAQIRTRTGLDSRISGREIRDLITQARGKRETLSESEKQEIVDALVPHLILKYPRRGKA